MIFLPPGPLLGPSTLPPGTLVAKWLSPLIDYLHPHIVNQSLEKSPGHYPPVTPPPPSKEREKNHNRKKKHLPYPHVNCLQEHIPILIPVYKKPPLPSTFLPLFSLLIFSIVRTEELVWQSRTSWHAQYSYLLNPSYKNKNQPTSYSL